MKKVHFGYGIVLALFAMITLVACPRPTDPVTKSANAYIDSITVSGTGGSESFPTRLSPGFDRAVMAYDIGVRSNTNQVTITVKPESDAIRALTIGGLDSLSTKSATIAISDAETTIPIVVTPESESADTKTYTLTIKKAAGATVPVEVTTVDSINGTLVNGVIVKALKDSDMSVLDSENTDINGVATLNLIPNQYVYIETSKTDHATNTVQKYWVDSLPASSNTVTAINKKLGMTTKDGASVICTGVYYTQNSDYSGLTAIDMTAPDYILQISSATYLVFEIYSKYSVEETAWSGFGAKIGIDVLPTVFDGISPSKIIENVKDTTSKPGYSYKTRVGFALNSKEIVYGYRVFNLVAYDIVNNRLHMAIPVKIISPLTTEYSTTEPAFAEGNIFDASANMRTYMTSREYFGANPGVSVNALDPYMGNNISYAVSLKFGFFTADPTVIGSNAEAVRIRGFDVYRSTDNATWTKIATKNYDSLTSGSGGYHTYVDSDSSLVLDTLYYYKFRAFADGNLSKEGSAVYSKLLLPFQAELATPANRSGFDLTPPSTGIPDFTFTISNTSLWNAAFSDYFYFMLVVRDKVGGYKYAGMFRYNFTQSRFEARLQGGSFYELNNTSIGLEANDIAYSGGTITIKPAVLLSEKTDVLKMGLKLAEGCAYEWDVHGDLDSSWYPPFFLKEYKEGSKIIGTARSYGGPIGIGDNAVNGSFEFYVN